MNISHGISTNIEWILFVSDVAIVWIKDEQKIEKTIKIEVTDDEDQGKIVTAKKKPLAHKNKFQVVTVKQEFVEDETDKRNTIFVRPDLVTDKKILPDLETETHANSTKDDDEEIDELELEGMTSAEVVKKLRAQPRLIAAMKEEIKIAQRSN